MLIAKGRDIGLILLTGISSSSDMFTLRNQWPVPIWSNEEH